ncbi:MAG: hypothetical protein OXQ94_02860 [Gemmatimonadota bacterium]|nr:hypothetical protein [Gemmatimonadota bacterium]
MWRRAGKWFGPAACRKQGLPGRLFAGITDPERVAVIGGRIIECETGAELPARISDSR